MLPTNRKTPPAAAGSLKGAAPTQTRSQRAASQQNSRSQRVVKAEPSFEGVELLQYIENGSSPNYQKWKEQLTLVLEQKFPDLSRFMTHPTFEYWKPKEVKLPTADEEAADVATGGYKRSDIKGQLAARRTRMDKMDVDKTACFAFMMQTVSEESKEGIAKLDDYDAGIKNSRDPALLMEAFELTHSTKFSTNSTLMAINVENQYTELKQHSGESLLLYKRRIESTLCMYDAIGLTRPSDATTVNNMMKTVNQAKYDEAIKALLTAVRENMKPFPSTTQELYVYLVGRVPDSKAQRQDYAVDSVFTTTDQSKQQKKARGKTTGDLVQKLPSRDCRLCPKRLPSEEKKHWEADCPHLERFHQSMEQEAKQKKHTTFASLANDECDETNDDDSDSAWVTLSATVVAAVAGGQLGPSDILFDCAATASIVNNADLLTDIQPLTIPRVVSGVGGSVRIMAYGVLPVIGRVLYSPSFPVSVISQSKAVKHDDLDVDYLKTMDRYSVTNTVTGEQLTFLPRCGLYVCAFPCTEDDVPVLGVDYESDEEEHVSNVYATTADQNKLLYTKREVAAADAARHLVKAMAYPSMADMFAIIKAGIAGSTVTAHDLHRALKIYGPFIPSIQGKTTRRATPLVYEDVPKSIISDQVLHADLLFVDKTPFLISVSKPLGLTIASHLKTGKGATALRKAMTHQIHQYRAQGFKIKTLVFDGEGAMDAIADDIAALGTNIERVPPGAHVGVVERKNREIKERFRSVTLGLWFTLPILLIPWLVYFCVSRINMLPSHGNMDSTSPRENFTGRKIDFRRDLRLGFGDYVHVHEDRAVTNTTQSRTEEAICLLPLSNLAGSGQFLSISTLKVKSRRNYTILPVVPDTTLERINAIAAAEALHAGGNAALAQEPVNGVGPLNEDPLNVADHVDAEPVEGQAEDFPGLEQAVHNPPVLMNMHELMAAEDQPINHEEAVPVDIEPVDRRYPIRSNRTSYRDPDRVYKITVKKALNAHGKKALRSIYSEIKQMPDKNVFTPQDPKKLTKAQLRKVIMSSMFLKEKFLSTGDFEKLKSRLVAGGHQQDKDSYDDISSPTVATSAAFMVASLAALERRYVVTVDIAGAYLNADMTGQEVLMKLDQTMSAILVKIRPDYKPFLTADGTMIVRLNKALYGCIESAKLWYEDLLSTLTDLGFVRNPVDLCIFNKGSGSEQCTICLHVDDLKITCCNAGTIEHLLDGLTTKYKTLTVHRGPIHSYLGMTFDYTVAGVVKVTMEKYVQDIIDGYQVTGKAATPASVNLFDLRDSPVLSSDKSIEFHSRVAKLLYLAKRVRPDILTPVAFLSTRTRKPTDDDQAKLNRVLRYINSTKEMGMILQCTKDITILVYADASYGVHADGKSHTGVYITLGRGGVFFRSTKQKIVTKSSTESELIGLSDSLGQAIWTRDFLIGQGYKVGPAKVFQDNKSTITLAAKGRSTSDRTRHIHIRYFFVKDRVDSGEVDIEYKPTKLMLADLLTKPLQGDLFRAMRQELLNWE